MTKHLRHKGGGVAEKKNGRLKRYQGTGKKAREAFGGTRKEPGYVPEHQGGEKGGRTAHTKRHKQEQ